MMPYCAHAAGHQAGAARASASQVWHISLLRASFKPAHHRLSTLRLSCVQGKAAQEEAARLAAAVAEEQRNVRAALQALEAERARLTALAEAEKARLQKQVRNAAAPVTSESDKNAYIHKTVQAPEHGGRAASRCK